MVGLLGFFFVVLPLVLICYSLQYVLERLGEFCLSFFRKQIYVLVGSIARSSVPDTPHYNENALAYLLNLGMPHASPPQAAGINRCVCVQVFVSV